MSHQFHHFSHRYFDKQHCQEHLLDEVEKEESQSMKAHYLLIEDSQRERDEVNHLARSIMS